MCRKNHGGIDRALFTFDLSADLRPAFHWNIHQLFVFVVAEYKSDENVRWAAVIGFAMLCLFQFVYLDFKSNDSLG